MERFPYRGKMDIIYTKLWENYGTYTVNIDLPKVEGLVSISKKVMFFVC